MKNIFIKQIYKGKTIYRILFNEKVKKHCAFVRGNVLDLAGGNKPSYLDVLPLDIKLISTDYPDVDFNKPLPFSDNYFDAVFLFNAVYIAEDVTKLLGEVRRVLKSGGRLYIASPFIANEMPEPHDYRRFTGEGLLKECASAGFHIILIDSFGERFSSAVYLLNPFFIFNTIRFFVYYSALFLDKLIPKKISSIHATPLGYFCIVEK
jgi:SAM-dependent methyltransferase